MSIEALKEQARRHEQNEEWQKALDQYQKAIRALAKDDQTDIGLYNRVGDLFVRVGKLDAAVEHYEQAVELYREAYLPNNAIAVCKKIIRNVPKRHEAFLTIGQIRAEQGFLPDARTHFLTYAERKQKDGNLDESFRALIEFCDLAPDEVDVRIQVADQMAASGKEREAVQQLLVAYGRLQGSGESDMADAVGRKILALDPDADLSAAPTWSPAAADGDLLAPFGEIEFGSDASGAPPKDGRTPAEREFERVFGGGDAPVDDAAPAEEAGTEEDAAELPMMSFEIEEGSDEEEGAELPIMAFDDGDTLADDTPEDATPLPTLGGDEDEEAGEALDAAAFGASTRDEREPVVSGPVEVEEVDAGLADIGTTPAEGRPDVSEGPARHAAEAIEEARKPTPPPASAPPPAPAKPPQQPDYVDFGAMVLGGKEEKTTRFKVAYEEPTGDEEADFAKMLSQFKEKVSENLDSSDVRAHHDLGTAYKEMGLLDEAIGSFQAALRASATHLPTYELMGQTFIEMGKPEAAVKSLRRALDIDAGVEDELIGIYYYLARAYETLGQKDHAIEFYDRVFSLDINFADVTDRLRTLR